jgi:cell wall-active antibiotic response 4TMS protein YvqF
VRVWHHELFWPAVLIVVGLYFLLHNLGLLEWLRADIFWPLVVIGLGLWLILRRVART